MGCHSSVDASAHAYMVRRILQGRPQCDKLMGRRKGERRRVVDFLVKYVRSEKVDGAYLPEVSGGEPVWNWRPDEQMLSA